MSNREPKIIGPAIATDGVAAAVVGAVNQVATHTVRALFQENPKIAQRPGDNAGGGNCSEFPSTRVCANDPISLHDLRSFESISMNIRTGVVKCDRLARDPVAALGDVVIEQQGPQDLRLEWG